MKIALAISEFEKFAQQRNFSVDKLLFEDAVYLMLEFYRQVRTDEELLKDDGDMLIFEWGTFNWGDGQFFQCQITRQFILNGLDGDDAFSQFRLCLYFDVKSNLSNLKEGHKWCESLFEVDDFKSYIQSTNAYQAVAGIAPTKIDLYYSPI